MLRISFSQNGVLFVGLDPKIMVQCASIVDKDEKACDTMVHQVDKVLTPAKNTIFEQIQNDPALSKVKQLLTVSSIIFSKLDRVNRKLYWSCNFSEYIAV